MTLPPTYKFDVASLDIKNPRRDVMTPCHVMLPHWLFSFIAHEYPKLFEQFAHNLEEFWTRVEATDDPHMIGHPMKGQGRLAFQGRSLHIVFV